MRAYLRIGCAAATLALAAPAQAAPHWTYGTSEHFEVYTTAGAAGIAVRFPPVVAYRA